MVGLINCSNTLDIDVVWLRGKAMIGQEIYVDWLKDRGNSIDNIM